jgi:hypothetical protein
VSHLLLADSHTYVCRTWDDLAARLVWAPEEGYRTAKARRAKRLGGPAAVGAGSAGRGRDAVGADGLVDCSRGAPKGAGRAASLAPGQESVASAA